jgi:hypothetical protein
MIGAVMAAFGAIAAAPTENGMDRPGGVYSYIPAQDAAACAVACAQDKICLAWSFTATEFVGCALKAIVPPPSSGGQIESGIAPRASEFLSLTSLSQPAPQTESKPAPPPPPEKPRPMAEAAPAAEPIAFEPIALTAFAPGMLAAIPAISAQVPNLIRVSLTAPTPNEEEFAGATPDALLRVATLTPPPKITVTAPASPLRIVLNTPVLSLEEEFAGAAPASFLHVTTFTPAPAAPTLRALSSLTPVSLSQRDFAFESEFEGATPLTRFTPVSAPARVNLQAPPALADPGLMAAPLLRTETVENNAPPQVLAEMAFASVAAEPAQPAVQSGVTQTAALEEDLLGGPDSP